jgi:hypothetical protein
MSADTANFNLDEYAMNDLGYEFYNNKRIDLSLQSFRCAVCISPKAIICLTVWGNIS